MANRDRPIPDYDTQRFEPPTQPWRRPVGVFRGDRPGLPDNESAGRGEDMRRRREGSDPYFGEHHRASAGGFGRTQEPDETQDYRGGYNEPDKTLFRSKSERDYARHLRDHYEGPGEPAVRRGPKGYQRSDARLYEEICELLSEGEVDASDVSVRVEAGECTLEGTVGSRRDKRRVEEIAEQVRGLTDVHNRLRVHKPTPT